MLDERKIRQATFWAAILPERSWRYITSIPVPGDYKHGMCHAELDAILQIIARS
jgi:hypothetical protein